MKKATFLFLSILLVTSSVVAQNKNTVQPELDTGTIEQQFDYIINKSTQFKEFKLIRKMSILKVKAHVLDSTKKLTKELQKAKSNAINANNKVTQLTTEVVDLNTQIEVINKEVDQISFLGIPLSKTVYNSFLWILILALLAGLGTFMFLFKKGHALTKSAQEDLEKTNSDFENFRKKALTKEQETMRKLQNEINKQTH
jgi:septal ring factor EnvC (AmiA/AmiB activator)